MLQGATWCVANPNAPADNQQKDINVLCDAVDCSSIKPGGACFDPNTVRDHASVVFNRYYKERDSNPTTCNFGGDAMITTTNPCKSLIIGRHCAVNSRKKMLFPGLFCSNFYSTFVWFCSAWLVHLWIELAPEIRDIHDRASVIKQQTDDTPQNKIHRTCSHFPLSWPVGIKKLIKKS